MIEITKGEQILAGKRLVSTVVADFGLIALLTLFCPPSTSAASLVPATSKAWDDYVESANRQMEQRLTEIRPFLWVDESPDRARSWQDVVFGITGVWGDRLLERRAAAAAIQEQPRPEVGALG